MVRILNSSSLFALSVFASLLFLTGCLVDLTNDSDKIKGTGPLENENYQVTDFSRVSMSIPGELLITQGDMESLSISAQGNLIPYIEVSVIGDRLRIETDEDISLDPTLDITILLSITNLDELDFAGEGLISIDTLSTTSLSINFAGSGDVEINQLSAEVLELVLAGEGDLFFAGDVDSQEIVIAGEGDVEARNLESRIADINITGKGAAFLNVSETLEATITGEGSVRYLGSPVVETSILGEGSVEPLDN